MFEHRFVALMLTFGVVSCVDDETDLSHDATESHTAGSSDSSGESGLDSGTTEGVPEAMQGAVAAVMEDAVSAHQLPGMSVYVMHPDQGEWSHAVGQSSLTDGSVLTVQHAFRAGSNVKPFVAAAVLQQVERGALALGSTLAEVLGDATADRVPNGTQATVRMLLKHRSGVPEWFTDETVSRIFEDPAYVWTDEDMLAIVETIPAMFEPDTAYGYSNTNYNLLGAMLESVAGQPWREVVTDEVLAVAGVSAAALPPPGDPTCDRCARGHELFEDGTFVDTTEIDSSMAGASGGHALVVTPRELSAALRVVLEGDVFAEPDTVALMKEFSPAGQPDVDHYGMGLISSDYDGVHVIGHLGGTAGFLSFNFYLPDTGYYVAGFTNRGIGLEFLEAGTALVQAVTQHAR